MTMHRVFARKKKPPRERLNWLLVAIASGRYGHKVTTTTPTFLADYVAAVNGTITASESGPRCMTLGQDLAELVARGHLTRERAKSPERGATSAFHYGLTSAGETHAAIAAQEKDYL
ncbi:hypothetical protein AWB67_07393 [Caballeronia terrestris]|uniref:Uncharacterized protein n=3 Tax=Caballeronia TaxID=1827195 RepID=A0A158L3W8_9BURK|nr:hypothetical protein [Caballeronia terrestris]SAL67873.1 hypothetical protein AWB65_06610 [Caballeronia humi]SAL87351.1 hypothetical protein AWB67_07393 [Caballeronia terrestris]